MVDSSSSCNAFCADAYALVDPNLPELEIDVDAPSAPAVVDMDGDEGNNDVEEVIMALAVCTLSTAFEIFVLSLSNEVDVSNCVSAISMVV